MTFPNAGQLKPWHVLDEDDDSRGFFLPRYDFAGIKKPA
jgi:hypothetical protein